VPPPKKKKKKKLFYFFPYRSHLILFPSTLPYSLPLYFFLLLFKHLCKLTTKASPAPHNRQTLASFKT
jgi:hypothetical protein